MADKTYKDIQREAAESIGVSASSVRTCWIAEVKRAYNMTRGIAPNRGKGSGAPSCPPRYWEAIKEAILSK